MLCLGRGFTKKGRLFWKITYSIVATRAVFKTPGRHVSLRPRGQPWPSRRSSLSVVVPEYFLVELLRYESLPFEFSLMLPLRRTLYGFFIMYIRKLCYLKTSDQASEEVITRCLSCNVASGLAERRARVRKSRQAPGHGGSDAGLHGPWFGRASEVIRRGLHGSAALRST